MVHYWPPAVKGTSHGNRLSQGWTGSGKDYVDAYPRNHIYEQKNCAAQLPATNRMQQHELVGLLYRVLSSAMPSYGTCCVSKIFCPINHRSGLDYMHSHDPTDDLISAALQKAA